MDLCKPLCLKSHDIQKVQVLERQREGVKNGVSTLPAKRQWLVYNKWCPAPLRACTGRPQEDGCKERCGARSRSIVLKSSWEHNSAQPTPPPPTPLGDDGVLTCCLYAEGVSCSAWGRSPPRLHLPCQGKIHRSAHTLLLVTAALRTQPSPFFL